MLMLKILIELARREVMCGQCYILEVSEIGVYKKEIGK